MTAFSPVGFEMLVGLVHKGPDGSLSARLGGAVIRRVQIRNPFAVDDGFNNRRRANQPLTGYKKH